MRKLCSGLTRVCYIRLDKPTLAGMKMNIGVEPAKGDIL